MKNKIAAIIILSLLAVSMLCGTALAEPDSGGSADVDLQNEDYSDANVVLDFYRIAIYDEDGYHYESDFAALESKYPLKSVEEMDAATIEALAQDAARIALLGGQPLMPAVQGAPLLTNDDPDRLVDNLLLGFYLVIPRGQTGGDYIKQIGNQIYTIAKSEKEEYRFLPSLVSLDYDNPNATVVIKASKGEEPPVNPPGPPAKTGDTTNMLPYYIAMGAAVVVIIVIIIIAVKRRKKEQ